MSISLLTFSSTRIYVKRGTCLTSDAAREIDDSNYAMKFVCSSIYGEVIYHFPRFLSHFLIIKSFDARVRWREYVSQWSLHLSSNTNSLLSRWTFSRSKGNCGLQIVNLLIDNELWIVQSSGSQPFLPLDIRLFTFEYSHFSHKLAQKFSRESLLSLCFCVSILNSFWAGFPRFSLSILLSSTLGVYHRLETADAKGRSEKWRKYPSPFLTRGPPYYFPYYSALLCTFFTRILHLYVYLPFLHVETLVPLITCASRIPTKTRDLLTGDWKARNSLPSFSSSFYSLSSLVHVEFHLKSIVRCMSTSSEK